MKIAVIGGGAAGFFAAIHAKINAPESEVTIFEKTGKVLSKVKVSGGGRCNVTNCETSISKLTEAYPRGGKQLKKALGVFSTSDTQIFFEKCGVPLKTESDGRVFPKSDSSQSIIDCLMAKIDQLKIDLKLKTAITEINPIEKGGFHLKFSDQESHFDRVIICTGGGAKKSAFEWLEKIGQPIVAPVPSLFTFNMPNEKIKELMGVTIQDVLVKVQGEKLISTGPLLITHWGMSGPVILKLSSMGARMLADKNYHFQIIVNWCGVNNEEDIRNELQKLRIEATNVKIKKFGKFGLPQRLWEYLLTKWEVDAEIQWGHLNKKSFNRIVNGLTNDIYIVKGKTTFKEEFVTAGGVDLNQVNFKTMESRIIPGLYFAGEVLDIDGITGGFNFQSAWTTGYIAGVSSVR